MGFYTAFSSARMGKCAKSHVRRTLTAPLRVRHENACGQKDPISDQRLDGFGALFIHCRLSRFGSQCCRPFHSTFLGLGVCNRYFDGIPQHRGTIGSGQHSWNIVCDSGRQRALHPH